VQSTVCTISRPDCASLNELTQVICLQSANGQAVPNFKKFYPGLSMPGKHFLLSNRPGFLRSKVSRHYTVCNVMRPKVYQELLRLLRATEGSENFGHYLGSLLTTQDENKVYVTIKNYKQPTGLSMRFFSNEPQEFETKGPMGKPLGIEPTGTYVVFAGGTGLLPFMDLVG
jgi:hypothetical protein